MTTHSDVSFIHTDRKLSFSYSYRSISIKSYAMYKKSIDREFTNFGVIAKYFCNQSKKKEINKYRCRCAQEGKV